MVKVALKHIIFEHCIGVVFDTIQKNFMSVLNDYDILKGSDITKEYDGRSVRYLVDPSGKYTYELRYTKIIYMGDEPLFINTKLNKIFGLGLNHLFKGGIILYD